VKWKQVLVSAVAGIGLLGMGFWIGAANAATAEPGTTADPLVSKSYVDQLVASLASKSYVDQVTSGAASKAYVDQAVSVLNDHSYVDQAVAPKADKEYVDGKTSFAVVSVPQGSTLLGQSGTEIVLRGGKATAVVTAKGGVLDATGGTDLYQGQAIAPNHLLVIPVSDGRGLTAQTDVILIVKGSYTVNAPRQ
jgi:hypothetical protein